MSRARYEPVTRRLTAAVRGDEMMMNYTGSFDMCVCSGQTNETSQN